MRVALLVSQFPSVSETFVLQHAASLRALGHDPAVYATAPPDAPPRDATWNVRYRPPLPRGTLRRTVRGARAILRGEADRGMLLRSLNPFAVGRSHASFRLIFDAVCVGTPADYDILHAHFAYNGVRGHLLRRIGALTGRLVVTVHGVDMAVSRGKKSDRDELEALRSADLLLPVSRHWADRLVERGCDPQRVVVHRVGVDMDQFAYRPREPRAGRPFRVVSVARLVPKKGIEHGVRAVAALAKSHDIEYTIVGDGPCRAEIESVVRSLQTPNIRLAGKLPHGEVRAIIDRSDALLAPSVTAADGDQEGIPVALMEAMASGVPVVSTLHSGIPELVTHDQTGLLAPEADVPAFASLIQRLIDEPELGGRLARAARAKVEADHNQATQMKRLIEHYQSLIDR